MVKNPPAMKETQVQPLGWEDPLEKDMATHSSILAWRIPWTEEPVGLQSTVSHTTEQLLPSLHLTPVGPYRHTSTPYMCVENINKRGYWHLITLGYISASSFTYFPIRMPWRQLQQTIPAFPW